MKKELKLFLLGFAVLCMAILFMPSQAFAAIDADGVNTEAELEEAIATGGEFELTGDITTTKTIKIEKSVTIKGNGNTITSPSSVKKTFEVYGVAPGIEVVFDDVTIENKASQGRCIDIRTGYIDLTLDATNLTTIGSGNTQTLNVGGNSNGNPIEINVTNGSVISASDKGYGIITFNPVTLTIDNSIVEGYGALYMKGADESTGSAGSTITVKNNSLLSGYNLNTGSTDDFGTIVFEDGDIDVKIIDSEVGAFGATKLQRIISSDSYYNKSTETNTITISGNSVLYADSKEEIAMGDTTKLVVEGNNVELVIVNEEPEKIEAGTYIVATDDQGNITGIEKAPEPTTPTDPTTPESNATPTTPEKAPTAEKDSTPKTGSTNAIYVSLIALVALAGIVTIKNRH